MNNKEHKPAEGSGYNQLKQKKALKKSYKPP